MLKTGRTLKTEAERTVLIMDNIPENKCVLAMYDVRGIQDYIFRTSKMKDAIGASAIVEDILDNALEYTFRRMHNDKPDLTGDLNWCDDSHTYNYNDSNAKDIQVLYIGGGNAYVTYRTEGLCREFNQIMAKYVLDKTYSLQLAVAFVEKSGNYNVDYRKLQRAMQEVKANMVHSMPIGALPVMRADVKTGRPVIADECKIAGYTPEKRDSVESMETYLKRKAICDLRRNEKMDAEAKKLDSYVEKKGVDSTLAVVHIDGNNMGLRIRNLVQDIADYTEAVNKMRQISFSINSSYKKVFEQMKQCFDEGTELERKKNDYFVMKVLVAGDDVTYICNGKIALATVEYFCKEISKYTLMGTPQENGKRTEEEKEEFVRIYGFSVCAGIAYFNSHFPFSISYDVAEECCDLAKKRAKSEDCRDGDRIGNFVDFQLCQNIHARNLKEMRHREYMTSHGEQLLIRPYFISTDKDFGLSKLTGQPFDFQNFKDAAEHFLNPQEHNGKQEYFPGSLIKDIRNTYPLGKNQMENLKVFLESRDWKLPGNSGEFYVDDLGGKKTARWYDVTEMLDYYIALEKIVPAEQKEGE